MRHNNHCFHCGESMPNIDECSNEECRVGKDTLASWPWQRCACCGERFFFVLNNSQKVRFVFFPIISITLFIIGFIFLSSKIQILGIVIFFGWFFSRAMHALLMKFDENILILESLRIKHEEEFNRKSEVEKTPKEMKLLKDRSDRIRASVIRRATMGILKNIIDFSIIFFILVTLMSFGPGNIFPVNGSGFNNKISQILESFRDSSFVVNNIDEIKVTSDWDNHKIIFLHKKLRRERGLNYQQYQDVINHDFFNIDVLVDKVKKNSSRGEKLYNILYAALNKKAFEEVKKEKKEIVIFDKKSYSQKVRENFWITLTWLNLFFLIYIMIMIMIFILTFVGSFLFEIGDESWDNIKVQIETFMEKHGLKNKSELSSTELSNNVKIDNVNRNLESDSPRGLNIMSSILGSGLIELMVLLISKMGGKKK